MCQSSDYCFSYLGSVLSMLDNVFVSQYLDGAEMLLDLKVPASLVGEYYLSKTYCGHILNISVH